MVEMEEMIDQMEPMQMDPSNANEMDWAFVKAYHCYIYAYFLAESSGMTNNQRARLDEIDRVRKRGLNELEKLDGSKLALSFTYKVKTKSLFYKPRS